MEKEMRLLQHSLTLSSCYGITMLPNESIVDFSVRVINACKDTKRDLERKYLRTIEKEIEYVNG